MEKFRFPKLNANMEEATIIKWHKREGDKVAVDELLLEIATDKGVIEVNSSVAGTVRRIAAAENSTLPVGYIIALIGEPEEALPEIDAENRDLLQQQRATAGNGSNAPRRVKKQARSGVRASPAARRLAREYDIALDDVKARLQVDVVNRSHIEQYVEEMGI